MKAEELAVFPKHPDASAGSLQVLLFAIRPLVPELVKVRHSDGVYAGLPKAHQE
jgi:hypothetical protein